MVRELFILSMKIFICNNFSRIAVSKSHRPNRHTRMRKKLYYLMLTNGAFFIPTQEKNNLQVSYNIINFP